jgi:hypothetical protein
MRAYSVTIGRLAATAALSALALSTPASSLAGQTIERVVERHHQLEIVEAVTDDVCGDVAGGEGLRSGVFTNIETGHQYITVWEDKAQFLDFETGTYSYDFDDPSIPDVSGYHYTSPLRFMLTKGQNVVFMENQHEFLPGSPNGIRIWYRYHATWQGDTPIVEREFFKVTGCA